MAMLVLSQKVGQRVFIGDDIAVMVLGIRGDRVRLGFSCPPEMPVHREEVHRRIADSEPWPQEMSKQGESPFFVECA
jgi:carbon storage regulator